MKKRNVILVLVLYSVMLFISMASFHSISAGVTYFFSDFEKYLLADFAYMENSTVPANTKSDCKASLLFEPFESFNSKIWIRADYTFASNKGYFYPENVSLGDGFLVIGSPTDSIDGGGIESKDTYAYGSYIARMQCAKAPGTLCTFFLFASDAQGNFNEVDIEIYNDGSRKIDFVTHVAGVKQNYTQGKLPFDPADDFHEYQINFYPTYVSFYIDGQFFEQWNSNIPQNPMKIMANFWWPTWMVPSIPHHNYQFMKIDWIKYYPLSYDWLL